MTTTFSEDDIYRTSTQYRFWSFSPESLADLRKRTHNLALQRLKQYGSSISNLDTDGSEVCLTEVEALELVQRYCEQLRTTSDHFKFPPAVKATAVQYLKRFYLSNSVLTYPPKEIYKTILFLACKTEGTHLTLSEYARRISTEKDVILAPEYKIMQALRFTLDVKQPFRGLKGVLMELLNQSAGLVGAHALNGNKTDGVDAIETPPQSAKTLWRPSEPNSSREALSNDRVQAAYTAARISLDAPSLLTDVYFFYTPSQILLACLHLADPPLYQYYLASKLQNTSSDRPRVFAAIESCADMIAGFTVDSIMSKDRRSELENRLEKCRDPSTKDLVKNHQAAKLGDSDDEQEKAAKRKSERANHLAEGNELFGPSLRKS